MDKYKSQPFIQCLSKTYINIYCKVTDVGYVT